MSYLSSFGHDLEPFNKPSAIAAVSRLSGGAIQASADGRKDGGVDGMDWEKSGANGSGLHNMALLISAILICKTRD